MKNHAILIYLILLKSFLSSAQDQPFIFNGRIHYEKSVNTFSLIRKSIGNDKLKALAFEGYMQNTERFAKLNSTLFFNDERSLYIPETKVYDSGVFFGVHFLVNQYNTIYTDFLKGVSLLQKNVSGVKFLLNKKPEKIIWKYTDEIRNIVGYECRRANGLFRDSIYVVAFYTEEIPISSGPESFNGLPGMILGIAIPSENVTWYAIEVEEIKGDKVLSQPEGELIDSLLLKEKLIPLYNGRKEDEYMFWKGILF